MHKKNSPKLPLVFLKHDRNTVHVFYFLNRKHVPVLCLYRVIETQVKVWKNEKCSTCSHSFFEFSQTFTMQKRKSACLL